ncbi:phosphate transporter permease subunit PstC [Escherichia coli]|uniref:Phosphate transporter permease subunit PstC n=1 Tax=Escherichia coli TaxID=562 RepID=A0A2X3JV55_ECOLX|nr:phosphate transporter permease subunit PstC [Escherichia coli]
MAATKPAFNPPGKKGDIIFRRAGKTGGADCAIDVGWHYCLSDHLLLAEHSEIWSGFPLDQRVGCTERYLRALVPIYGTLVTSFIALLIAVPVSFGIALFLTELAPGWLKRPLGIAIELLAAIPSIVYGMWGLFIFAAAIRRLLPGAGRQYHVEYPDCWRAVLWPRIWYRYPRGRRDPRHHDYSVHLRR